MKKLLLTSTGFTNPKIGGRFLKLVDKRPSSIKVLFIPTASVGGREMEYVKKSEQELTSLGIPKQNIFWLDINDIQKAGGLNNYNVIYVCGGNTFLLMSKLLKTGFDKKLIDLVKKGTVYVGVSAGSVVAGPDISIAGPFDKNDVGLKSPSGLQLTDKVISPHYQRKEKSIIEDFKNKLPYQVIPLTDNQALEETDDKSIIIE